MKVVLYKGSTTISNFILQLNSTHWPYKIQPYTVVCFDPVLFTEISRTVELALEKRVKGLCGLDLLTVTFSLLSRMDTVLTDLSSGSMFHRRLKPALEPVKKKYLSLSSSSRSLFFYTPGPGDCWLLQSVQPIHLQPVFPDEWNFAGQTGWKECVQVTTVTWFLPHCVVCCSNSELWMPNPVNTENEKILVMF